MTLTNFVGTARDNNGVSIVTTVGTGTVSVEISAGNNNWHNLKTYTEDSADLFLPQRLPFRVTTTGDAVFVVGNAVPLSN